MTTNKLVRQWVSCLILSVSATFSCGQTGNHSSTETNWLRTCSEDGECGGLDCVCGICSQACQEVTDCTKVSQATRCAPPEDPAECEGGELTICLPHSELPSDGSNGAGGEGSDGVGGTSTGVGGGSGGDGTAGAGGDGSAVCSTDDPCGERQICDYADDSCGANGALGICVDDPLDCAGAPLVCSCDGQVTSCPASDKSRAGGCELQSDQFPCGEKVCTRDTQVCVELELANPNEDEAPYSPSYYCWEKVATSGCEGQATSCSCLSADMVCNSIAIGAVATSCEEPSAAGVAVSCLL